MTTDGGVGRPLTDDEVRALGFEPTPQGWVPIKDDGTTRAEEPQPAKVDHPRDAAPVDPAHPRQQPDRGEPVRPAGRPDRLHPPEAGTVAPWYERASVKPGDADDAISPV